jgi:hypothetical protein
MRYLVRFYASLADNGLYALNTLGGYFSKEQISRTDYMRFEVEPQIVNDLGNPLTDPDGWMLITDTFSSRYGGERFLTLGNFNTTATSDTLFYNPTGDISARYAYYYIDDVSLVAIDSIPSGVNETEGLALSVYPNPAQEFITISSGRGLAMLRLLDLSGRSLRVQPVASDRYTLPLQGIGPGIYLLEATDRTGRVAVQKVVVQ